MLAALERIRCVKCTYEDCDMSFDTEKIMRRHKEHSDEHDYCKRCDEDFDSFEDYAMHKIVRPDTHGKACRVCGDEFKSESGLKRHIELTHKVDQKLTCIGCQKSFYRACLFIEHLEFGHCDVIEAEQFHGHIIHKHLITELLKGGEAYYRFMQKTSKYEAAVDYEEEGGVVLGDDPMNDDEAIDQVEKFKAIAPDTPPDTPLCPAFMGPYPPLPTQSTNASYKTAYEVASTLGSLSLNGNADSDSETVVECPIGSPVGSTTAAELPAGSMHSVSSRNRSTHNGSTSQDSSVPSTSREAKVWGSRSGKSMSSVLFPNAKSTPSVFSVSAHDEAMDKQHGINIMRTRFWDPMSSDWNPEKFYDSVVNKYSCPFVCEQIFESAGDLDHHIRGEHRITRMKCPACLRYFKNATALMAHCESRGARCQINKAEDFNIFIDRISGGFLGVKEKVRPDHLNTRKVMLTNAETGHMEVYSPTVACYLQYTVTKPPDWKDPVRPGAQIGGFPNKSEW
ncbi:hypothetical protein EJ02DRAFT_509057 [Clathrospora elynae]|uniref:C2H2-type domain-containing protein n=1 Tax=Clathrospora elynae TaxID=706981 RepID=A0A6A5SZ16_9PLEO|nr:hypothetical protein EJ02DRAFT_509057 [Clathrospora elynae]